MRAAVLHDIPAHSLEVELSPEPLLREADDLIVTVNACGICGTDIHILAGGSYRPELPFILGHEPVGVVTGAGPSATAWLGRRITITLFTGCGECFECHHGDERLCPKLLSISGVIGAQGGYAERMRVHASQAVDVPAGLSDRQAAVLVDGGATAANAVRVVLALGLNRVAVVGGGPIGFLAAEILRDSGIAPALVHRTEPRRSILVEHGYQPVPRLEDLDWSPEAIIDCSGDPEVTTASIAALAPAGAYVAAGYSEVPRFPLPVVARKELTLRGVRSGRRDDLVRVMDLAASGRISLPPISTWPLTEINAAIEAIRSHRVAGKAVILPGAAS